MKPEVSLDPARQVVDLAGVGVGLQDPAAPAEDQRRRLPGADGGADLRLVRVVLEVGDLDGALAQLVERIDRGLADGLARLPGQAPHRGGAATTATATAGRTAGLSRARRAAGGQARRHRESKQQPDRGTSGGWSSETSLVLHHESGRNISVCFECLTGNISSECRNSSRASAALKSRHGTDSVAVELPRPLRPARVIETFRTRSRRHGQIKADVWPRSPRRPAFRSRPCRRFSTIAPTSHRTRAAVFRSSFATRPTGRSIGCHRNSGLIEVAFPAWQNAYMVTVLDGVNAAARADGYEVVIGPDGPRRPGRSRFPATSRRRARRRHLDHRRRLT